MPDAESPKKKLDLPGWIGIILVALGGLAASTGSYWKGIGDVRILERRVDTLEGDAKESKKEARELRDRLITIEVSCPPTTNRKPTR
jgi:hypothetical protein